MVDRSKPASAAACTGALENLSLGAAATVTHTRAEQLDPSDPQYAFRLPIALLLDGLDVLARDMSQPVPATAATTPASLTQASELLQHSITKFVLFLSREADPSIAAKESQNLSIAITNVVCLLRAMLGNAGKTQHTAIVTLGSQMLARLSSSILQLQSMLVSGIALDAHLTGIVWEACKNLTRETPFTNAQACGKLINAQLTHIKDARKELMEIKVDDDDACGDDNDFDDDDDDFDDNVTLSADEFRIVPPSIELVTLSFTLVRLAYAVTLKSSDSETPAVVEWMEQCLSLVTVIATNIDAIGAGIDANGALAALTPQYKSLVKSLQSLLEIIPAHSKFPAILLALLSEADKADLPMAHTVADLHCSVCQRQLSGARQCDEFSKPEWRWLNTATTKIHALHQTLGIAGPDLSLHGCEAP